MIGKIEQTLCNLADRYHANGMETERVTVQRCLSVIHELWADMENAKQAINKKPDTEIEKWILCIPDLKVFMDKTDGTIIYELDDLHFDSATEVAQYLIDYRTLQNCRAKAEAKIEIMKFINKEISKIDTFKKELSKPKNVVRAKIKVEKVVV